MGHIAEYRYDKLGQVIRRRKYFHDDFPLLDTSSIAGSMTWAVGSDGEGGRGQ